MATGYTHPVKDGKVTTLEQFAWSCARAFGGLIHLRDSDCTGPSDPGDPPEDYSYEEKSATEAEAELTKLEQRDDAAWKAAFVLENENIVEVNRRRTEEASTTRQRYEALLAQVSAWEPPTLDHRGLRDFMLEQLHSSVKHDCDPYLQKLWANVSDFKTTRLVNARDWAARSKAELAKAKERSRSRIEWVRDLRTSLAK
jgi:hypothetical protein